MTYSIIGPNLFMDERGVLFEKVANDYRPIQNQYTEAEERFVQRHMREVTRGGSKHETA